MPRPLRIAQPVKIFRVGGSVRDELLGLAVTDRDWVVVGATPETMVASGFRPVGRDFPVFLHPDTHEEYALARTERKHGRGYRGFEFFASPDVTLEEDLRRRDLTINAMARDEQGTLIDPFGGERDLRAGVLRHVSPAFAEDPLRVLRVARFAARFGFAVAPDTAALMRALVASGELRELPAERVWQELSRGLLEAHPSRMLAALRKCGALAVILPEVDALFRVRGRDTPGTRLERALDYAAARLFRLPVRYAVLVQNLDAPSGESASVSRAMRLAEAVSARLRVPIECRDAARLAARWHRVVHEAADLPAHALLDLLLAADALRRPERLDVLLEASECDALPAAAVPYAPRGVLRGALAVVKKVDAAAVARDHARERKDAIARAIRAARLASLRQWRSKRG